ncbi:Serine protease P54, partial [Operophtera brumata]
MEHHHISKWRPTHWAHGQRAISLRVQCANSQLSEYRFAGGGYPRATSSSKRSGGLCSAALVGGALLAAVAVLAVAALAFYMGALRPDNGEPMMSFEGSIRVTRGDVYGGSPGSPAWRERARRYGAALRQVYAAPSPLRQAFTGAIVTGFGDRRLDVHFRLYLDRRKIPSTVANIEETLKNIIIQDLNSKHPAFGPTIKIDTSSITIKRDLEHTYQSESYVKEALNESMATNYPKTPQTGKDKILQSRVGVVRKTTVKPNKNDPDEPDIDTENIPVVQGSFQITKTEADITENKKKSSPVRHDEKPVHKISNVPKSTTTTKAPTTRATTTKRVPTSTPNSRPFTMKSTLNVKTRTEPTSKKDIERTTTRPVSSTTASTSTTTTLSTTTTFATTTSNVSQILFDLLTNENHYKDLPKIDSLFTVPHVIDNEPWRPITQPYYDTRNKPTTPAPRESYQAPIDTNSELNAEDRMGVAEVEVIDDAAILDSMLSPIPPVENSDKTTRRPIGLHKDPYFGSNVYEPNPVYTSFTFPTYAPPLKNMETLGSSYPKPFPIPVDKISSVVEGFASPDDEDDGKPVPRPPPKDKKTSVTLNVELDQKNDETEKILLEGASILKKVETSTENDSLTTTTTTTTTSTTTTTTTTPVSTTLETSSVTSTSSTLVAKTEPSTSTVKNQKQPINRTVTDNSTRRPNNKVSIIPSTNSPHQVWELVNTSTNDKNETSSKNSPETFYNDTLQAIITKNDAVFPNTTPKFPSKVSIMRNLTEIIKKYSQKPTVRPDDNVEETNDDNAEENAEDDEEEEEEERQDHHKMTGTVEVVLDDEIDTTTAGAIITLLPAKSNLGGNRPLRRRPTTVKPQLELETVKEKLRNFFDRESEAEQVISNMSTENYDHSQNEKDSMTDGSEIVTAIFRHNEEPDDSSIVTDNIRAFEILNVASSGNRYPKSNNEEQEQLNVPEGTYRVSYHVTGSVSSKQANKTQNLPAYELTLEPDVVLEIPSNQNNSLTIDKLRQLANLATISNSNNNTLFRAPGGGVISTKAIPSSYTLNQAGFKILTKTFNYKGQSNKQDENSNSLDKPDKNYKPHKPQKEKDNATVKEVIEDDWCKEGQYVCANARQCLEMTKVCDGSPDCPLGDDEKSCVALGDELEDNEVVPYNEEGYVMVRKRGVWGRLCVESFADVVEQAHSSLKLPDLGRAVCRSMTFQDAGWAREAREGRKMSSAGYWEVWHNAAARAADTRLSFRRATCNKRRALRVRCTGLDCGIRPHADAQQPRATEAHWVARLGALRRGAWPRGPWERVSRVRQVILHPRYAGHHCTVVGWGQLYEHERVF